MVGALPRGPFLAPRGFPAVLPASLLCPTRPGPLELHPDAADQAAFGAGPLPRLPVQGLDDEQTLESPGALVPFGYCHWWLQTTQPKCTIVLFLCYVTVPAQVAQE